MLEIMRKRGGGGGWREEELGKGGLVMDQSYPDDYDKV